MFSNVFSSVLQGMTVLMVNVEVDVGDGLPAFDMVGYLSSQVKEAKERVRVSLKNSGYPLPPKRITVNLSPADIRKESSAFDLPIAVAILISLGIIPENSVFDTLIVGELSLDGTVNRVNGILPIVSAAQKAGIKRCIVPHCNGKEGGVIKGIQVIGVKTLSQLVAFFVGKVLIEPFSYNAEETNMYYNQDDLDFIDVLGQGVAKRAITIGVCGMHNILLIGAPGTGKTMLAKRISTIMPKLSIEESIEISKVYSISGLLDEKQSLIVKRPFRSPHHTATAGALAGGGRIVKAGEISLASGGVLFLDELPEFSKNVIEILRQPLEEKKIRINRVNGAYVFPANFMLVAAMNPCNCGYYPDRNKCVCTDETVKRYIGKISKPLIDRIDICVEMVCTDYEKLTLGKNTESSQEIRNRVEDGRRRQEIRFKNENINFNSELTPKMIEKYCIISEQGKELLKNAYNTLKLSIRGYHKLLKTAKTIADIEDKEEISKDHIGEAICYRSMDQKYWGV